MNLFSALNEFWSFSHRDCDVTLRSINEGQRYFSAIRRAHTAPVDASMIGAGLFAVVFIIVGVCLMAITFVPSRKSAEKDPPGTKVLVRTVIVVSLAFGAFLYEAWSDSVIGYVTTCRALLHIQ